jgi:DMSO/TMAO reductase YedYZ molybdopterin-dependent catalytic subunit
MTIPDLSRRRFLQGAGIVTTAGLTSSCDVLNSSASLEDPVKRVLASANSLTYRVHRLLQNPTALAPEFSRTEIRQPHRANGVIKPPDADYNALADSSFETYELKVTGLVETPLTLSLNDLRAMPFRNQITRHDCVEGWSCIAEWTGVPLSHVLKYARPKKSAQFALIRCYDTIERSLSGSIKYYETIDMADAYHPQTILAYGLNGETLPIANGAPLRLRVERQLGYKMAKYVREIELISGFTSIGGGKGGYWEDRGYDWYAGI